MSLFSKNKLTPPPPRRIRTNYSSPLKYLFLFLLIAAAVILTGCPSPSEGDPPGSTTTGGGGGTPKGGEPGGGTKPGGTPGGGGGTPGSGAAVRTLSFNLELSEPNGAPLALGSGPARTIITSDKGTLSIGTVSGKIYPVTVSNVPQAAGTITLTVKKRGFADTKIGPIAVPALGNPGPQVKTIAYATTVSGKVTTPAGNIRQSKREVIVTPGTSITPTIYRDVFFDDTKAQVWASTDPDNKVTAAADGSYSLNVVKHSGTFTVIAEYTAGDGNYKTSDPREVSTTAPTYKQDIVLKYGYTTTVSGRIFFEASIGAPYVPLDGATVIIKVEGVEAGRDISKTSGGALPGSYSITVAHPGTLTITVTPPASSTARAPDPSIVPTTSAAEPLQNFTLSP